MKGQFGRDHLGYGIALGLVIPIAVYGILLLIFTFLESQGFMSDIGFPEDFRTRTLGLLSICSNLVTMQLFRRRYRYETMRGVLIATMVLVAVWFFKFGLNILRG